MNKNMHNNIEPSLEIFCTIKNEPRQETCHKNVQKQSRQCEKVNSTGFVETMEGLNDFKEEVEDVKIIKTEIFDEEVDLPSIVSVDELNLIQQSLCSDVNTINFMKDIGKKGNFMKGKYSCLVYEKEAIKKLNDVKKEVEAVENIKTEILHEECDLPSIKSEDELYWTQQVSCNDTNPKNYKKAVGRKNCKIRKYSCLVCRKADVHQLPTQEQPQQNIHTTNRQPLSNAERQRKFRAKRKLENAKASTELLSKAERQKIYREKKKLENINAITAFSGTSTESSVNQSQNVNQNPELLNAYIQAMERIARERQRRTEQQRRLRANFTAQKRKSRAEAQRIYRAKKKLQMPNTSSEQQQAEVPNDPSADQEQSQRCGFYNIS